MRSHLRVATRACEAMLPRETKHLGLNKEDGESAKDHRLDAQHPSSASASTKIRLSILGVAMVDALGGPAEFHRRFSFPLVVTMVPNHNFSLPAGVWTDDTSMTLCLARSLATFGSEMGQAGGFDEAHQLDAYIAWYEKGVLSAIGRCFDIGSSTRRALTIYAALRGEEVGHALHRIDRELGGEDCAGNGSLMRVIPIGLAYWADEAVARDCARRSSTTTHPNKMCQEACEVWTVMVVRIMQASTREGEKLTKLDLVKILAEFPYTTTPLRNALALPSGIEPLPSATQDHESYYRAHHPILRLIARMQTKAGGNRVAFQKTIPTVADLPSTGYVLHTFIAALYCFFATENFEAGATLAVNLGNDADTVGAVYAGLAGVWYGEVAGSNANRFWTERVEEWKSMLFRRELVEEVADELARFSAKRNAVDTQ